MVFWIMVRFASARKEQALATAVPRRSTGTAAEYEELTAAAVPTYSYVSGASDEPLRGETIGAALRRQAQERAGEEAIVAVAEDRRLTYGQLDEAVDELARALLAAGIGVGDRVALYAPNCADWVLVQYAVAWVGGILVALNPAYRAEELAYALEHSGSRLLFATPSFKTSDYREIVGSVHPRLPELSDAVFFGTEEHKAFVERGTSVDAGELSEREGEFDFDALVAMQYTSGTTGKPKAATLTHHNILNNAYFGGRRLGYGGSDRVCVPVPLFHIFGTSYGTLATLIHGATMVLPGPAFEPAAVIKALDAERCTSLYGVPAMFVALLESLEEQPLDLPALRTGLVAGAACPPKLMRRVVDLIPEVGMGYGMTETSPCSFQSSIADDLEDRVNTVGTIMPHVEVKIADPATGRCLPRGERGEICTRGYSVMPGYWQDPERTEEAIDRYRWMHTGDVGVMDDRGYLRVVGRIKDIVIRGGENIDATEIEARLFDHEDVVEAYVVGVPDERMGEELMAWVRRRDGANLDDADVRGYLKQRLSHHKVPRYVQFTDEFPVTSSGKVQKFRLREQAIEELDLPDE
jgi:fatty-acyl-CoA synthase